MTRPLETAWANHSEKLHGPPYEREAATSQSLTETCNIHSRFTHKVQTRAVGSAEERFVQTVRLASCDLNMKTGGGQGRQTRALVFQAGIRSIKRIRDIQIFIPWLAVMRFPVEKHTYLPIQYIVNLFFSILFRIEKRPFRVGRRKRDVWTSIEEGDKFSGKRRRKGIYGFALPQRDPTFALK